MSTMSTYWLLVIVPAAFAVGRLWAMIAGGSDWCAGWRAGYDTGKTMAPLVDVSGVGFKPDETVELDGDLFDLFRSLDLEIGRQDRKWGPFGGETSAGATRLALACLHDEVVETLDAWRDERADADWFETRTETMQVAAVAIRAIRDTMQERRP